MPYLGVNDVDDFLEAVHEKYVLRKWTDISMNLQKYYFASRLFNQAAADDMEGGTCSWRLQIAYNDTFEYTGLYADNKTSRTDLLTHASIGWSMCDANYTYDILEKEFRGSATQIIDYMLTLEHGMYNSYFAGKEKEMFGTGPTSPTQATPPACSLLWWIQPYNTASGYGNNSATYQLASGVKSDFLGMNPYGFDSVGTANVDRKAYSGWRNRVGTYDSFSADDAVDTIIECIDKCNFQNAHSYPALVGGRPNYELLTTYSVVKKARKLLQDGNDNIRTALDTWKIDAPMLRSCPLLWVPAWSNQDFGLARTDGIVLGVDWSTFHYYSAAGLRMVRRPIFQDPNKRNVRWQYIDDSGQLACYDCRRNFAVTSTATETESN